MTLGTEAFWLLTEPFDPTPDPRFLVPTAPVRKALARLDEALVTVAASGVTPLPAVVVLLRLAPGQEARAGAEGPSRTATKACASKAG